MNNREPIFIVGMPRSGTTLMQSLLNHNSELAIAPETHFFVYLNSIKASDLKFDEYIRSTYVKSLNLNIEEFVNSVQKEINEKNFKSIFDALLRTYLAKQGKTIVGEKTPAHYEHLDTIFSWYPRARVIWLIRDPRAVASSYKFVPWGNKGVISPALRWRGSQRELLRWQGDERIHTVRYEDLVLHTDEELKKVYTFLGIRKSEEIDYEKNRNVKWFNVNASTIWERGHIERASSPISENSVEKWVNELSPSEIAVVETITRKLLLQNGYEPIKPQSLNSYFFTAVAAAMLIKREPKSVLRKLNIIQ